MTTIIEKAAGILFGGLFLVLGVSDPVHAELKRHLVVYGGIHDRDIPRIAAETDLLIAGTIRVDQIGRLKAIRPNLKVLKYHHPWGLRETHPGWETARRNPDWFSRDIASGERIVVTNRRFYLMRFDSPSWQQFIAAQVAENTLHPSMAFSSTTAGTPSVPNF